MSYILIKSGNTLPKVEMNCPAASCGELTPKEIRFFFGFLNSG